MRNIGCQVRFLLEAEWSPTQYSLLPESFAIFDGMFVYIRRDSTKQAFIRTNNSVVLTYRAAFDANWEKAVSFNELDDLYHSVSEKVSF